MSKEPDLPPRARRSSVLFSNNNGKDRARFPRLNSTIATGDGDITVAVNASQPGAVRMARMSSRSRASFLTGSPKRVTFMARVASFPKCSAKRRISELGTVWPSPWSTKYTTEWSGVVSESHWARYQRPFISTAKGWLGVKTLQKWYRI